MGFSDGFDLTLVKSSTSPWGTLGHAIDRWIPMHMVQEAGPLAIVVKTDLLTTYEHELLSKTICLEVLVVTEFRHFGFACATRLITL